MQRPNDRRPTGGRLKFFLWCMIISRFSVAHHYVNFMRATNNTENALNNPDQTACAKPYALYLACASAKKEQPVRSQPLHIVMAHHAEPNTRAELDLRDQASYLFRVD